MFGGKDAIIFPDVKTHYGYSNIEAYKRTGKFTCTVPGFYLIIVTVLSTTDNSYFQIFKNSSVLSNGFVSSGAGSEQNSGTSEVITELELNDTITIRAGSNLLVNSWDTCSTIVKVN